MTNKQWFTMLAMALIQVGQTVGFGAWPGWVGALIVLWWFATIFEYKQ